MHTSCTADMCVCVCVRFSVHPLRMVTLIQHFVRGSARVQDPYAVSTDQKTDARCYRHI